MQQRWTAALLLTVCVALFASSPSWAYRKISFRIIRPPVIIFEDVEVLAILPFYAHGDIDWAKYQEGSVGEWLLGELVVEEIGEDFLESGLGEGFASEIRARLTEHLSETQQAYRVAPGEATRQAVEERGVDPSEMIGDSEAATIAGMLGADAVLWGTITYEGKTKTYEEDDDKKCRRVEAESVVHLRVIDAGDHHVIAAQRFEEGGWKSACGGDRDKLPTVPEMVKRTLDQVMDEIPRYVTPFVTRRSLELQKVKARAYRDQAAEGVESVRLGDYDRAIAVFEGLSAEHANDPRLHYNLGVVCEAQGKLDRAEEYYRRAHNLNRRDRYHEAIKRVKVRRIEIERLAMMGVTANP